MRFVKHIVDTGGCWLWTGALQPDGYPRLKVNGQSISAHRWAYEYFWGPVPEGMQVDHLCQVRHCVHPLHLEAVTPRVNTLRSNAITAQQARQTHCSRGHPFDEENTVFDKRGHRSCRQCRGLRLHPGEES